MVLSDTAVASPGHEQSILRWIMGDVEDPSMGLNIGGGGGAPAAEFEFSGDINVLDQGFELDPVGSIASNMMGNINPSLISNEFTIDKLQMPPNPMMSNNLTPTSQFQSPLENTTVLINHHQAQPAQNPSFFLPFPYPQTEPHLVLPPPAKRYNPSIHQQQPHLGPHNLGISHHQPHLGPHNLQGMRPKTASDEVGHHQNHHRDAVVDQLYKAAEQVQAGNSPLAQAILARLNHHLSPIGKPFHKAAFFCKEALQLLLHTNTENCSPFNLILKIGAYKSFAEMSPQIQFSNFTCNQAILEALEGFDRIHVIDFDIGYGGQWASLMQELALRSTGAPALKITAFASLSTHDQLELGLTAENLTHFAGEIKMGFEFEISNLDCLNSGSWPLPLHVSEHEAIAVNLPLGLFTNSQLSLSMILQFVKLLSPKIVVSVDKGCDRTDLPFPNHVIHTLQTYSNLLESLDAVNVNPDALRKIERFLIQPDVEKTIMGRYQSPERIPHWRNLFLSSQFYPLAFSNFTESQAECVVKRTPVRGFHVEKRQNSLVLCWQQKELVSASAWRC